MSNILAALVGGLGAGAQSLGASRFQEQEQRRREAAAEAQRLAVAAEQGEQRRQLAVAADADRLRARTAGGNSIRALFPDFQAPEGDFDPQVVLRGMLDRETSERQREREAGLNERLSTQIGGRMGELERRIESMNDLNAARAEAARAQADAARINAGANQTRANRPPGGGASSASGGVPDQASWVRERMLDLRKPDRFGDMPPVDAVRRMAEEEYSAIYGGTPAPSRPSPGATLMQGLGVGGRPPLDSFRR
jgi:hypothetical protein